MLAYSALSAGVAHGTRGRLMGNMRTRKRADLGIRWLWLGTAPLGHAASTCCIAQNSAANALTARPCRAGFWRGSMDLGRCRHAQALVLRALIRLARFLHP